MQQAAALATSAEQVTDGMRYNPHTHNIDGSGGAASTMKQQAAGTAGGGGIRTAPLMYMYSGHDSNISPLLAALGQPESHWPPFTANLVYELWQRVPAVGGNRQQQQGRQQGDGDSRQWDAGGGGDEGQGGEQQGMRRRRRQAFRLRRHGPAWPRMAPQGSSGGGGTGGGGRAVAAKALWLWFLTFGCCTTNKSWASSTAVK